MPTPAASAALLRAGLAALALALTACAQGTVTEPGPARPDITEDDATRDIGSARDVGIAPDSADDVGADASEDAEDDARDVRGDAADEDTGPRCDPPRTLCGEACVLLDESVEHCGACDSPCSAGEVCVGGSCADDCGALVSCAGDCVDPATSLEHCGACDSPCRADEICDEGACVRVCPAGEIACDGVCVDPDTDGDHCGACGSACDDARVCVGGACACASGLEACEGRCIDVSDDPNNCGACGDVCGLGEGCRLGRCVCAEGLTRCGDVCTDIDVDSQNCGFCARACGEGELCLEGDCSATCAEGEIVCEGACVVPETSASHCGGCGVRCLPGQLCEEGLCACPEGTTLCDGACRDLASDDAHCGACGSRCEAPRACEEGACGCPDEGLFCEGACVSASDDPDNCGACGDACPLGAACVAGICACPEGTEDCGAGCIDVATDPDNCGACGARCEDDLLCIDGACADACPLGLVRCDGVCVDPGSSAAHCGGCGNACGALESCQAGACACQDDHLASAFDPDVLTYVTRGSSKTPSLRGAQLQDLVLCEGDADRFAIYGAGAGTRMYIALTGACALGPTGLVIELQSPEGTTLATSNAGGEGTCPALQYRTLEEGWHTLIVSGAERGATYALDARIDDIPESEDNDSVEDADGPVSRDSFFVGEFDSGFFVSDPRDIYRLDVLEYATIRLQTEGQSSACDGDSVLRLLDAEGEELARDDDGGSGLCSSITRFVEPGAYFAEVTKFAGEGDFSYRLNYTIDSQFELEPNDSAGFENALGEGTQSVEGALQRSGDVDRFALEVPRTGTLRAWTSGLVERCTTDTIVTIRPRSGGEALATNDDTRDPDSGAFVTLCSDASAEVRAGDYVVEVSGFGASVGEYLLHLVVTE